MKKQKAVSQIIDQVLENGRCLVKLNPKNQKMVRQLAEDCVGSSVIRAVPWGCGNEKYILFADINPVAVQTTGEVIFVDFKAKKVLKRVS
jgi:hypothetical protein